MGMTAMIGTAARRLWAGVVRAGASPAGRVLMGRALDRLRARDAGGRRLATLMAALPLPALAVAVVVTTVALVLAPARAAAALQMLALLPEGLWWALASLVAAVSGLRLQAHEQAFARDMGLPPSDLSGADPGSDAGLALDVLAAGDNPALVAWLAAGPVTVAESTIRET